MTFFAIPNLISKAVSPCAPWEFRGEAPATVRGKKNKTARETWISDPTTNWQVFSAFEGVDPNSRVAEEKAADEGNPPLKLHGFVADVDADISDEELQNAMGRLSFIPNYFGRSLSHHVHIVWLFEKPVLFPNYKFAAEFMERALAKSKLDHVAGGFDKPAWCAPNRLYTNGGEWYAVKPEARISFDLLNGWILETAEKHVWKKDRHSVVIPLPDVQKELEKKWPNFWPGDFLAESQGPSFWLPGSASSKSAIVKPTGFYTFSSSATKPFYSWADLIGADFVRDYSAKMMGAAVEEIHHDGKAYFRKDGFGNWKPFTKEDIGSHLKVDRGLSAQKVGEQPSEVERAIQYVQNWHGIDGAAPFVFQPPGIIVRSGATFLNTHTRKTITPAKNGGEWGPKGGYPFLSEMMSGFYDPEEQLDYDMSWTARFFRGCHFNQLESGHFKIVLGKPNMGKTLWSQGILPLLFGGGADAEAFLLGKTDFNSELFNVALWTVDDNSANVDDLTHRKFSAIIKKMAANTTFSYHEKFRVPCRVEWLGRVVITGNDDEQSSRIVPDATLSLLDKMMLFRTAKTSAVKFPPRKELNEVVATELPHFARYLVDHVTPKHCEGSSRFGVKAYQEPTLLQTAEHSSRSATFHEIVDDWAQRFFEEKKDLNKWEGTSWQFLKMLHAGDITAASAMRSLTADAVSRQLMSLKSKGFEIEARSERGGRIWTIHRPVKEAPVALPAGEQFKK